MVAERSYDQKHLVIELRIVNSVAVDYTGRVLDVLSTTDRHFVSLLI